MNTNTTYYVNGVKMDNTFNVDEFMINVIKNNVDYVIVKKHDDIFITIY